jgi:hypothetical protein
VTPNEVLVIERKKKLKQKIRIVLKDFNLSSFSLPLIFLFIALTLPHSHSHQILFSFFNKSSNNQDVCWFLTQIPITISKKNLYLRLWKFTINMIVLCLIWMHCICICIREEIKTHFIEKDIILKIVNNDVILAHLQQMNNKLFF